MPRGRPAFKPTAAHRRKVQELKAAGMSHADIGRAIGCGEDTVEKYFAEEIATGRAVKRAEVIGLLFKNARRGNVTAQKHLQAIIDAAPLKDADGFAPPAPKPEKLGKKEQAIRDAQMPDLGTPLGQLMAERQKTLN